MHGELLSARAWIVFIGSEAILAGVLWMIGLLSPLALIISGVALLSALWAWDNRPAWIPIRLLKVGWLHTMLGTKPPARSRMTAPDGGRFPDTSPGNRDDYDIVAQGLIIRGTRTDDGVDISGIIQYRNRSAKPVYIKVEKALFTIDGKTADKATTGVNALVSKEHTDSIRFLPIRVYNEHPVDGQAHFSFMFGSSRETMRTIISMTYDFTVVSFPQHKSTDAVLQLENPREDIRYFVKNRT